MSASGPLVFDCVFFILAGSKYNHKVSDGSKFRQIRPRTAEIAPEVAALEGLEKSP